MAWQKGPHLKKPGAKLTHKVGIPKALTHGLMGHKEASHFTAPHNRSKRGTTIPKGAPGKKSGTTTPTLGKQMSVSDILNFKFPKL